MFQQINKSSSLTSKAMQALKTGVIVEKEFIEEQLFQISKTKVSPIADRIMKAYEEQDIVLIYNEKVHLSIALPFLVVNFKGKPRACIFIADFSGLNKEGTSLNIDMKKLYCLMEAAFIGLKYYTEPNMFNRNSSFVSFHRDVYTAMAMRILNREYALSLEKETYDTITYYVARFFLQKHMNITNPEMADRYAINACKTPATITMDLAKSRYESEPPETIEDLIKFLGKANPKMANLSFRYFFERWISAYGTGACLSIDAYPYLYYVICNVLLAGFLINVTGLNELVRNTKGVNTLYAELARII